MISKMLAMLEALLTVWKVAFELPYWKLVNSSYKYFSLHELLDEILSYWNH